MSDILVDDAIDTRQQPTTAPTATKVEIDVGEALPLGLAGFGMTAIVLSFFNVGILSATLEPVVLPMAAFFGGVTVFIAGMWCFRANQSYPGVVLSAFGAFWLCFATYVKYVAAGLPAATAHEATGLFVLIWALFTLYISVPALRTNVAVFAVIFGTFLTFLFVGLGASANSTALTKVGGVCGIATGLTAMYTSFALLTNGMFGKTVLPLRPLS